MELRFEPYAYYKLISAEVFVLYSVEMRFFLYDFIKIE
jgi:hypothetical protein